jgi:hypothetical protein
VVYTLDFETIQQVMQEHQKTGSLFAELSSGVVGLREPCRAEMKIMEGTITSCTIVGTSGRRLTGKEAKQGLARLGRLRWAFTPEIDPAPQPAVSVPVPGDPSAYPCRSVLSLDQQQMHNWSRLHRAVFALADGTKSVMKIAELLSTAPELVEKALRDLQSIDVITLERRNRYYHTHSSR